MLVCWRVGGLPVCAVGLMAWGPKPTGEPTPGKHSSAHEFWLATRNSLEFVQAFVSMISLVLAWCRLVNQVRFVLGYE